MATTAKVPVATCPAGLPPSLPAVVALSRLLADGAAALRTDLVPALAGEAEAVHRMRGTLRRLRALLRLFRPLLPPAAATHDRALRRISRALSTVRDWDVFLDEILPRAVADGLTIPAAVALRAAAERRRRAAYASLRRRLDGTRVGETLTALLDWSTALECASPPPSPLARPLAEVAPPLLHRLARRVRRRARHLDRAGPAELHALRRAVRRLRDAADSLAPLAPSQRAQRSARACRRLAERLGRLNDATVAAALAVRLAGPRDAGAVAVAALAEWAERAGRRARRRVPPAWQTLRAITEL